MAFSGWMKTLYQFVPMDSTGKIFRLGVIGLLVVLLVAVGGSLLFLPRKRPGPEPGVTASDTIFGDTLFEPVKRAKKK
jgi:hypothetical protein